MTVAVVNCWGYLPAASFLHQGAARVKAAAPGDILGIRHRARNRPQAGSAFGGIRDRQQQQFRIRMDGVFKV